MSPKGGSFDDDGRRRPPGGGRRPSQGLFREFREQLLEVNSKLRKRQRCAPNTRRRRLREETIETPLYHQRERVIIRILPEGGLLLGVFLRFIFWVRVASLQRVSLLPIGRARKQRMKSSLQAYPFSDDPLPIAPLFVRPL